MQASTGADVTISLLPLESPCPGVTMPDDGKLDLDKLRSIGHVSRLTRNRSKSGREHPDSGEPYKTTRDELGNDVTEHGKRGAGVSDRQDVNIHPETVHLDLRGN